MDAFDIPASLIRKVVNVMEEADIQEVSAPGQEDWIKANKARFEKEYGAKRGKEVLYAKAWQMHNEETEHDKKQVAVPPRHENDSSVLLEKGKKSELDEKREVIIFDPEVDPNQLAQSDKAPK